MSATIVSSPMKKIALSLALVLVLAALLPTFALAASAKYSVAVTSMPLRRSASVRAAKVATLKKGAEVTVVGSKGAWYKVSYKGKATYAEKKHLKKITSNAPAVTPLGGSTGIVKAKTTLYKSNSTSSAKLATLKKGQKVSVTGQIGTWFRVKNTSGKVGFVPKSKIGKPASSGSGDNTGTQTPVDTNDTPIDQVQARLKELGYLATGRKSTGTLDESTVKALKHFQMQAGLTLTGKADDMTVAKLLEDDAPAKVAIVAMDWFKSNVNASFKKASLAYIIDCRTDTRLRIRRVHGTNHADVEPATAADTAILKKLYGGKWSWDTRPVILIVNGMYVAASINGMPHGAQISTTNNFNGQFCLHTTNSKTHATDNVNGNHQACIEAALKYLQ